MTICFSRIQICRHIQRALYVLKTEYFYAKMYTTACSSYKQTKMFCETVCWWKIHNFTDVDISRFHSTAPYQIDFEILSSIDGTFQRHMQSIFFVFTNLKRFSCRTKFSSISHIDLNCQGWRSLKVVHSSKFTTRTCNRSSGVTLSALFFSENLLFLLLTKF